MKLLRDHEPGTPGVPSLSSDEVATRLPVDAVRAPGSVRVSDGRGTISPPRVEVAIMATLGAWRGLPLHKLEEPVALGGVDSGSGDNRDGRGAKAE